MSLDEVEEKSKNILGGTLVTHQTGEEGKKLINFLLQRMFTMMDQRNAKNIIWEFF